MKAEKQDMLPSKAPFSKRFEDAVGQACESALVRRVGHQFHLPDCLSRIGAMQDEVSEMAPGKKSQPLP